MLFDNLKIIVEVILILVIIIGIVSSRTIAKRLSVIRETYNALEQMVLNLDSSTEHAGRLFEAMQQESAKGGKKLSALVEYARNATEDLQDLQKMATEISNDLDRDIKKADEKKAALLLAIEQAQETLKNLEASIERRQQRVLKTSDVFPQEFESRSNGLETDITSESSNAQKAKMRVFSSTEKVMDLPPEEEVSSAKFSDKLEGDVPQSLRNPRPYMAGLGKK